MILWRLHTLDTVGTTANYEGVGISTAKEGDAYSRLHSDIQTPAISTVVSVQGAQKKSAELVQRSEMGLLGGAFAAAESKTC